MDTTQEGVETSTNSTLNNSTHANNCPDSSYVCAGLHDNDAIVIVSVVCTLFAIALLLLLAFAVRELCRGDSDKFARRHTNGDAGTLYVINPNCSMETR